MRRYLDGPHYLPELQPGQVLIDLLGLSMADVHLLVKIAEVLCDLDVCANVRVCAVCVIPSHATHLVMN